MAGKMEVCLSRVESGVRQEQLQEGIVAVATAVEGAAAGEVMRAVMGAVARALLRVVATSIT
jgi:hypothetical protein